MFNPKLREENKELLDELNRLKQRTETLQTQLNAVIGTDQPREQMVDETLEKVNGFARELRQLVSQFASQVTAIQRELAEAKKDVENFEAKHFPNSRSKL